MIYSNLNYVFNNGIKLFVGFYIYLSLKNKIIYKFQERLPILNINNLITNSTLNETIQIMRFVIISKFFRFFLTYFKSNTNNIFYKQIYNILWWCWYGI